MRTFRVIFIVCSGILVLAALSWWLLYSSYLKTIKNLPKEITSESYFQILDALARLPKTQMLLSARPRPKILTDGKFSIQRVAPKELEARLIFPEIKDFQDVQARTARIFIVFPVPLNLSNTLLMARVRVRGNLIVNGHLSSRLQFELYDTSDRVLRGPKVVAQKAGQDFVLVVRPTVRDPVPTGFTDPGFDVANVKKIVVRFTLGVPQAPAGQNFHGALRVSEIIAVHDIDLITRFFPLPDSTRVTHDKFNVIYEFRKHGWRNEEKKFFIGINYPWRNYGWDFGRNPWGPYPPRDGWAVHEEELVSDFTRFREAGITHVRMYMFCEFRSALLTTENGYALDQYVLEDTEAMLRAAHRAGIKLIPVLFDFGIGNTAIGEYVSKGNPDLIFSGRKYQLFSQVMVPFLKKLDGLNSKYEEPIEYLELMNEPDNMALLIVPGYFESLKSWLTDLTVIIHNETSMKVTLGARSFADFQKWWSDIGIDAYQFHFYMDMVTDMSPVARDVPRKDVGVEGALFCGELDPHEMEINIPRLKEQGYDGVLLWSFRAGDGFMVDLDAVAKVTKEMEENKEK